MPDGLGWAPGDCADDSEGASGDQVGTNHGSPRENRCGEDDFECGDEDCDGDAVGYEELLDELGRRCPPSLVGHIDVELRAVAEYHGTW